MSKIGDIPQKPSNVRWWMMSMLTGFGFVSYMQRINISVAAEMMAPELHLTPIQIGQIFSSFLIGYAIFQIPGGIAGDRRGTRITLSASAVLWGLCTLLTGMVPGPVHVRVGVSFLILWFARFMLGSAEATTYPVGALAVHNWIQPPGRAFANSLMFAGTSLAAAFSVPFVSWLMLRTGWRVSFFVTAIPALVIALLWWSFSADTPEQHRYVNKAELALTASAPNPAEKGATPAKPQAPLMPTLQLLLGNRRVLLLCLSYIAEGYLLFIYVFWLYIYLVEVRGFSMLKGGFVTSLPWLVGLCLTPLGGLVADRIAHRRGRLVAAKYIVMVGYSLAGSLLFVAAYSPSRVLCVAALSLSVGFLMSAEASFWVSATYLAGESAGAVSGLMNTAGILGGVVSTSLVPVLVSRANWLVALGSGTLVALGCVLLWILIAQAPEGHSYGSGSLTTR